MISHGNVWFHVIILTLAWCQTLARLFSANNKPNHTGQSINWSVNGLLPCNVNNSQIDHVISLFLILTPHHVSLQIAKPPTCCIIWTVQWMRKYRRVCITYAILYICVYTTIHFTISKLRTLKFTLGLLYNHSRVSFPYSQYYFFSLIVHLHSKTIGTYEISLDFFHSYLM